MVALSILNRKCAQIPAILLNRPFGKIDSDGLLSDFPVAGCGGALLAGLAAIVMSRFVTGLAGPVWRRWR